MANLLERTRVAELIQSLQEKIRNLRNENLSYQAQTARLHHCEKSLKDTQRKVEGLQLKLYQVKQKLKVRESLLNEYREQLSLMKFIAFITASGFILMSGYLLLL